MSHKEAVSPKSNFPINGENMSKVDESIVIDPQAGLVFKSEDELFEFFSKEIQLLEGEYFKYRSKTDLPVEALSDFDENLSIVLEDPDEIWEDTETLKDDYVWFYIKKFVDEKGVAPDRYHVAACYLTQDVPSFVYLHFPTQDLKMVNRFRRHEKIYDRETYDAPLGAIDGDALNEGDELAVGLYKAMMLLRSEIDLLEDNFVEYHELREPTIEEPDEIWRNTDSFGNTLVSFIREYPDELGEGQSLWYVVVTLEDSPSNSHALMFSFPTRDSHLVDRYRHGENLHAEEVVQESSH